MAGRISPLLESGNEYSLKVPFAMIDGVDLDCDWPVGESIGPTFDVLGVYESPQAVIRNARRMKIGKIVKRFISIRPVIFSWLITNLLLNTNTFEGYPPVSYTHLTLPTKRIV